MQGPQHPLKVRCDFPAGGGGLLSALRSDQTNILKALIHRVSSTTVATLAEPTFA